MQENFFGDTFCAFILEYSRVLELCREDIIVMAGNGSLLPCQSDCFLRSCDTKIVRCARMASRNALDTHLNYQ